MASFSTWNTDYEDWVKGWTGGVSTKFIAHNFTPKAHHWRPVVEIILERSKEHGFLFREYRNGKLYGCAKPIPSFILESLKLSKFSKYFNESETSLIINELVKHNLCSQPVDELIYEMALP